MVTLGDLPVTDPSVARILDSLWLGSIKIKPDTVLNPDVINNQILMFQTAEISNMSESISVTQMIGDLTAILTYLEKKGV